MTAPDEMYGPELIAIICHEANRAYCTATGDDSQVPWDEAPQWQKDSAINGVMLHLNAEDKVSPRQTHEAGRKQKIEEGWKPGPVKDPEKKEHPCCVPYDELPVGQRIKDYIFKAVVEAFMACVGDALEDGR
jgi:hypothetical protein